MDLAWFSLDNVILFASWPFFFTFFTDLALSTPNYTSNHQQPSYGETNLIWILNASPPGTGL